MAETETIGERIRRLRKEQGLTQGQLAEKSNVSMRSIISYEKGQHFPQRRIEQVAKALGITTDDLM